MVERFQSDRVNVNEAPLRFESFVHAPETKPLDPKRPTVAFYDGLSGPLSEVVALPNGPQHRALAHAEASEEPARQRGYNVIHLEMTDRSMRGKPIRTLDFGKALTEIADAIDAKELRLGHGDVLNISANNPFFKMATFESASSIFGIRITPENLKQRVGAILKEMDAIASGKRPLAAQHRELMRELLASNRAIERIQRHGVEVVRMLCPPLRRCASPD